MFDITTLPIFFLGANTASGYVSRFGDCAPKDEGYSAYIIKGGPGSGKSSFMKRIAAALGERGEEIHLVSCTADPNSLDGVLCPTRKLVLLDGTSPHAIDPPLPGAAGGIINTGAFWDEEKLRANRYKIQSLFEENSRLHRRAAGYMAAAASVLSDSRRIAAKHTDTEKAADFGHRLAGRLIPKGKGQGREQMRFLSGVTPAGVVFYGSTVGKLCPKRIDIWDEQGAAAPVILEQVRKRALENGHSIITCRCPLHPLDKNEHILIPAAGLAFCTANRFLPPGKDGRVIHSSRFEDREEMRAHKTRLSFNRRAVRELLAAATEILTEAKSTHDILEQYYIEAMDFAALEEYTSRFIENLI